jgi:hypothetical protein
MLCPLDRTSPTLDAPVLADDIPAPVAQFVAHTNRCKRVQEDEEIQNDIDFSSIKPKLKSRR